MIKGEQVPKSTSKIARAREKPKFCPGVLAFLLMLLLPCSPHNGMPCMHPYSVSKGNKGR